MSEKNNPDVHRDSSKINIVSMGVKVGAVEKVRFYPQTPQGGLYNLLDFNKSPLGDLGV
jgi:hypothetical protein